MKKSIPYLAYIIFTFVMTSCELDDSGKVKFTWLGWMILGIFIAFIIYFIGLFIYEGNKFKPLRELANKRLEEIGVDLQHICKMEMYVGGHPNIDNEFYCQICKIDTNLVILKQNIILRKEDDCLPIKLGIIPIDSITNIQVEDKSSIEKKVTLGRILLVGIFALAWQKKEKHEVSFVTIEWQDGRFNHSTVFAFYGKDCLQTANQKRNLLLKLARE